MFGFSFGVHFTKVVRLLRSGDENLAMVSIFSVAFANVLELEYACIFCFRKFYLFFFRVVPTFMIL